MTYNRDIAPIVFAHCASCHHPEGPAPFSVLSYASIRTHARQVSRIAPVHEDQLRFVLRQGRKRQIRRMCELVGLFVTGLKRVRSGNVPLGGLPVGKWRYLGADEKF